MTLISCTSNFSYPIVIGDILTSSNEVEKELEIPVFLDGVNSRLSEDQELFPYRLRQKIYIIKDYLVVALAGLEYEMKVFLEELKNNFKYLDLTIENLHSFLKYFDFEEFKDSSALILFAEKKIEGVLIHTLNIGKWRKNNSSLYEEVLACGSGAEYFVKESMFEMNISAEGDHNMLNRAISLNYILLARILVQERVSLETIKKNWGAGFEMIYFNGDKFTKMDDVTYIIWNGKMDLSNGNYEFSPLLIMNFKYHNELLVITSHNGVKLGMYGVLPIYMKKEDFNTNDIPSKPHIDGKRVCSIYITELSNGYTVTPAFFSEKRDDISMVKLNDVGSDDLLLGLLENGMMPDPGPVTVKFDREGRLCIMVNREMENFLMNKMREGLIATYGTKPQSGANI
ncbi:hypothetical protein FY528_00195 [Hymenobacter lutimineralis]|uniref:Uncharacterized protein n=1 Tax=Hymenobacter lutimineralis TaxID=2606448 RepID=A0A5D6VFP0_9BACT|nr:hypothetical protein [Hymenobacter lutimineralis]TYZ14190.1 hypothetical protein FY528_00195 [Hymenobacter lutimineralis]